MTKKESIKERGSISSLFKNSIRLFQFVWRGIPWLALGIVVVVILGTLAIYGRQASQAFLINQLIESAHNPTSPLLAVSIAVFIIMFIVPQVFNWIRSFLGRIFRFRLEEHIDFLFFEKRGALDVAQ